MKLLGYEIKFQSKGIRLDGRIYAISHRVTNQANIPVQIIGALDPAGLDKKPANASRRMSAHALVQESLILMINYTVWLRTAKCCGYFAIAHALLSKVI